jgi:hypothetical protein
VNAPHPGSAIALTTKFFPMAFFFFFVKPYVTVNGYVVPAEWGRVIVPVPPGLHQVHVHTPYFLPPQVGPADLAVTVAPGQTVELEYKSPLITFSRGSLGPPPQKYNGMVAMIVLMAVLVLFIVCVCAGALSSN